MKLSKCYRKLKLLRDGASFASPESGHYKVERTSIMLPITLADEYNYHWEESGVYYEEIEEIEEIEDIEVEPIEVKDEFVKFIESKVTIENTDEPKDRMPTGATSLEKFYKEMEGKSSEETNREMQKRIAAKTLVL